MSPEQIIQQIQDPRRRHATAIRIKTQAAIRHFLSKESFIETPTPTLVLSPGMEPHIRPFRVQVHGESPELNHLNQRFLHTSPEFAMKKLLAAGLQKIFQLATVYRAEPLSPHHLPEFQMLEWYEAETRMEQLMLRCEALLLSVCREIHQSPICHFAGMQIDFSAPWHRFRIPDLFQKHAGIDLSLCHDLSQFRQESLKAIARGDLQVPSNPEALDWDDLYYSIWLNCIEDKLPKDKPCFVYDYPAAQAALSRLEPDTRGTLWARRFEIYLGGLELANAFEELTDPKEQRRRFEKDMNYRQQKYGDSLPPCPIDEEFISVLDKLPTCSGIALGVDRLIMVLAGESDIQKTVWFS